MLVFQQSLSFSDYRSFVKQSLQYYKWIFFFFEKVYFRSQILERPSIGEYWNISGVPVLPENVIFMSFRRAGVIQKLTILERKMV